jgi:hypothetical protein
VGLRVLGLSCRCRGCGCQHVRPGETRLARHLNFSLLMDADNQLHHLVPHFVMHRLSLSFDLDGDQYLK